VIRSADPADPPPTAQPDRGGRALVPELIRIADANGEAFFGALPADERAALMRLL
jgi:hypothetical protein